MCLINLSSSQHTINILIFIFEGIYNFTLYSIIVKNDISYRLVFILILILIFDFKSGFH